MDSSCTQDSSPLRSRHRTEQRLKDAIEQLQQAGSKVSISAVARAAEVTPALIHNTYPDIAEQIRTVTGKTTRNKDDAKYDALAQERRSSRALRVEVDHLQQECAKLASINLTLMNKLAGMYVFTGVRAIATATATETTTEAATEAEAEAEAEVEVEVETVTETATEIATATATATATEIEIAAVTCAAMKCREL